MENDRAELTRATTASEPLRVTLHWDCELVFRGLSSMLGAHADRIALVDIDAVLSGRADADVLMLDPEPSPGRRVSPRAFAEVSPAILLYTWQDPAALADLTALPGVAGYLSKGATASEVVAALEKYGVRTGTLAAAHDDGLSRREREVLALVASGRTNQEIAEAMFVTINTTKTYIRTAYVKIGVRSRSQAVAWAVRHLG